MNKPIVLFDGVCQFCDTSINFLLDHDHRQHLRFAALQSRTGQELLTRFDLPREHFNSLVLVEGNRYWLRSTAALRIAHYLDLPWSLLAAFYFLPRFLRDGAYDVIAANRYRWFGRFDACRVPTPEVRARFLE